MKKLIRYEYAPHNVWALWEGLTGDRWYEHIVVNDEVQW
jgi:hypothetical protein